MMSSHAHCFARSKVVGIMLLCALAAVSCSKQPKTEEGGTEQAQVDNVLVPVLDCDEPMVSSQLEQAVKASLNSQAQRQFNAYAQSAGEALSTNNLSNAVISVLVDIANPTMLQDANEQGAVTCGASLSLTLPNQDVTRAAQVYSALESRNLAEVLQAQNISLNNNMLVTRDFNYMLGMQGGQMHARIVGQPAIIEAAADMLAKSQFQATLDANLGVPRVRQPSSEPVTPSEPSIRSEPQLRSESEPRSNDRAATSTQSQQSQQSPSNRQPSTAANQEASDATGSVVSSATVEDSEATNSGTTSVAADPALKSAENESNKNIDMVIIEEEGTY
ncbi:hypothetical protein [Psychrobacter lutiphocae]|uniref:hypothetical protein n=1 Tax=Psychrobacter lutiphocae TaxID=540500 RepID=UPI0003606E6A|nr:hypothetical protein [Psychrobacter lutiphocae]